MVYCIYHTFMVKLGMVYHCFTNIIVIKHRVPLQMHYSDGMAYGHASNSG